MCTKNAPLAPPRITHSCSHPHNITWHASQGRSMIRALFIPSVLAIRLLLFPISPLGPLSATYIRSFLFESDDRAIKRTACDRQSGTSLLASSLHRKCIQHNLTAVVWPTLPSKTVTRQEFSGSFIQMPLYSIISFSDLDNLWSISGCLSYYKMNLLTVCIIFISFFPNFFFSKCSISLLTFWPILDWWYLCWCSMLLLLVCRSIKFKSTKCYEESFTNFRQLLKWHSAYYSSIPSIL